MDSILFRHLTGRAKPALAHPTSRAFEPDAWVSMVDAAGEAAVSSRDLQLLGTALLVGGQRQVLSQIYTQDLFVGHSSDEVVTLALADANRSFLIIKSKAEAATADAQASGRPLDLGAISQILIEPAPGLAPATADDLNTSVINTLPHWFAAATADRVASVAPSRELAAHAHRAGMILSLERAFRDVWQQALWQGWRLDEVEGGYAMTPSDPDWQAGWRVWDLREQSLHLQGAMLNHQIERALPGALREPALPLTVVAVEWADGEAFPVTGAPDERRTIGHRLSLDAIDDAYTRVFADQQVGGPGVTPALLSRVIEILQDLAQELLPNDPDPDRPDWSTMERAACSIKRATVVAATATCLEIDTETADACITALTTDPVADIAELFRIGLWHKPLVAVSGGERLLFAVGALVWGSPIRRTERWLQGKGRVDLSKTANGEIYEASVRALVRGALEGNPVLEPSAWAVAYLPGRKSDEQIDLLIRIDDVVLVCEIKCLLAPSEPGECYNYVRKLEMASVQAMRKAEWLRIEQTLAHELLADMRELRMVPLIVVNQSNGVGMEVGGCHVIDAHFLRIFLGDGEYHAGARFEPGGPINFDTRKLYGSAAEAAACLPEVFAQHLGVARYRAAIRWTTSVIPLAGEAGELTMTYPVVDEPTYHALGPFAED
ncbi:hypothetical protein KX816_05215 [Sphingosinicellaceae bacterium]|nr:hypothetical protein KX816_05215 [Sphingosinicellaceae bacterium]